MCSLCAKFESLEFATLASTGSCYNLKHPRKKKTNLSILIFLCTDGSTNKRQTKKLQNKLAIQEIIPYKKYNKFICFPKKPQIIRSYLNELTAYLQGPWLRSV